MRSFLETMILGTIWGVSSTIFLLLGTSGGWAVGLGFVVALLSGPAISHVVSPKPAQSEERADEDMAAKID